ncbi:hypothetical protein [Burkholderia latens]|uniref:hypothetical protein n=1 Tax=Burkholderia latens TaxID=488446 RepID=UPI001AEAE0B2|nr:hypothetical protein [Burkholderia latens]QTO42812.1 hypothetical protein J8I85_12185 [Burkholderia latens]
MLERACRRAVERLLPEHLVAHRPPDDERAGRRRNLVRRDRRRRSVCVNRFTLRVESGRAAAGPARKRRKRRRKPPRVFVAERKAMLLAGEHMQIALRADALRHLRATSPLPASSDRWLNTIGQAG